jgi:hypothetical protein
MKRVACEKKSQADSEQKTSPVAFSRFRIVCSSHRMPLGAIIADLFKKNFTDVPPPFGVWPGRREGRHANVALEQLLNRQQDRVTRHSRGYPC